MQIIMSPIKLHRSLLGLFLLVASAVFSTGVLAASEPASPEPSSGEAAEQATSPFMDLLTVGGEPADVEEHFNNGKWTLVMIWATNCHVCHEQKPMISSVHDERKDIDFTVMGIAIDGRRGLDKVKNYLDENKPSFPSFVTDLTVLAVNFELLTEESFRGTPTYLLFNPENELLAAQPGRISKEALYEFIDQNS